MCELRPKPPARGGRCHLKLDLEKPEENVLFRWRRIQRELSGYTAGAFYPSSFKDTDMLKAPSLALSLSLSTYPSSLALLLLPPGDWLRTFSISRGKVVLINYTTLRWCRRILTGELCTRIMQGSPEWTFFPVARLNVPHVALSRSFH